MRAECVLHDTLRDTGMCLLSVKDSLNNGFFLEKNGSAFLCSWQSTIGGGLTEAEMVGWHHQLNGPKFEQALGDGAGLGSLVLL